MDESRYTPDLQGLFEKVSTLKPHLRNISSITVSHPVGHDYEVIKLHLNVSDRIKDPVRRFTMQREAICTLTDIAAENHIEIRVEQTEPLAKDNMAIRFVHAEDIERLVDAVHNKLDGPESRITHVEATPGKA